MQRMTSRQSGHRAGFTILELLVVVAVIAILASLGFVMVKNFGQTSRDAQTQATIRKVDAALQDRLQSLSRFYENSDRRAGTPRVSIPVYVDDPQKYTFGPPIGSDLTDREIWSLNGSNVPTRDFIELRARKKFKQKHFPMNFSEMDLDNDGNSDVTGLAIDAYPSGHDPETENSEVLYYFLTQGAKFGSEEVAVVDFIDREIADTDGDGLMEIVDGWGNPIRFYRWPTRLIRPQPSGSETANVTTLNNSTLFMNLTPPIETALFLIGNVPSAQILRNDPQDPLGVNTAPADVFERTFHTKQTWHAPLVVSAGADGKFGLLSPTKDPAAPPGPGNVTTPRTYNTNNPANYGHLAQPDNTGDPTGEFAQDNISNLMLRVGGR